MERIRGRLALLALCATSCAAVPLTQAVPAAAQTSLNVPAATYTIDPKHTQIVFSLKHMALSTFFGRFGYATGNLTFDPAAPEKSALSAQIDMNNLTTHWDELDKELKAGVFHTDKFPNATFVATRSVKTGANTGTVTGNLTIAGVTKPVTLNVTFNGGRNSPIPLQPYRIGFDATGTIKRSDFGLNHAIWSGMVGDDVALWIECELEKK
jgi:polyisoprenoid-binding protein YceI